MKRLVFGALLAVVVAGASVPPVTLVHASTVQGTAVTISGLDDLNATVDSQARKGAGKIIALVLGIAGLGGVVSGYHMTGMMGVGSGIGVGFLPGIMSSAFDAAPAATGGLTQHAAASAWWAPATAGLYPAFLVLRLVQDPVFLVSVATMILLVRMARAERTAMLTSH
jgi:hypothetical protein